MTLRSAAMLMCSAFCAVQAQTIPLAEASRNRIRSPVAESPGGLQGLLLGRGLNAEAALPEGAEGAACGTVVTSFANIQEFNPATPLQFGGSLVIEATIQLNSLVPGATLFEFSESNPDMRNAVTVKFDEEDGDRLLFQTFDQNGQPFTGTPVESTPLTLNRPFIIRVVVTETNPELPRPNVGGAEVVITLSGVEVARGPTTAPVVATRDMNIIGGSVESEAVLDGTVTDFRLLSCLGVAAGDLALNGKKKDNDVATDDVVLVLIIVVAVLVLVVAGILVHLVRGRAPAAAATNKEGSVASSERSHSRRSMRKSKSKSGSNPTPNPIAAEASV